MIETDVQSTIRIRAVGVGMHLWRNNVGVLLDKTGRPVRYGLGNDSAAVNSKVKSSDLVGWWAPHAVFCSIECKKTGWTYAGGDREIAQKAWIDLVRKGGGFGCFATCWEDVEREMALYDQG